MTFDQKLAIGRTVLWLVAVGLLLVAARRPAPRWHLVIMAAAIALAAYALADWCVTTYAITH